MAPRLNCCDWDVGVDLALNRSAAARLSLQNQIFEQIRVQILDGRLRVGEPLAATRQLSEQLQVSRNTVALAYERLIAEGYVETRPSVGTFVSSEIPEAALKAATGDVQSEPRSAKRTTRALSLASHRAQRLVNPHPQRLIADFWVGRPDPNSFPIQVWSKLIGRRLRSNQGALTEYRHPSGLPELREEIAAHLRPARGIVVSPDQIIIVGGCQDGLNLVARMLVGHGSAVILESPSYQGAAYLFESFGAKLFPVPVDDKGIDTHHLPNIKNGAAYVTPSHQYPLGATLPLDRRLELLAWAARTDSFVIEDDYDSDFRFCGSPLTALKGLDCSERVIYLGTFSKCLGAGLRLGYVVVPPRLVDAAKQLKTLMNNGQPWLEQAALADFMASGGYLRHLRRIRKLYLARRNALVSALQRHFGEADVIGDQAGMHLVWRLNDRMPSASEIEACALSIGVGVYTLSSAGAVDFNPDSKGDRYLALGFSSLSETAIETGISSLAAALEASRKSGVVTERPSGGTSRPFSSQSLIPAE
jgi:GntR family transcriptional regulator / MocR family aminotransferase